MIGWLHCAAGVSGDMLLGALVDAGVPVEVLQRAVDAVIPAPVRLRPEPVLRNGIAATKVHVDGTAPDAPRTWAEIRALLDAADVLADVPADLPALAAATRTFAALAAAEAKVHGAAPEQVHFHEVGALDAIADVVGVCAGFAYLGLDELVVSPVALGGGTVRAAHGYLPVPGPAVVELLRGRPTYGGPVDVELTTPTGAALIASLATGWGHQPPMTVARQGFGAGTRELADRPNVLRLLVGEPVAAAAHDVVLETNVDDLDPRIWPGVLAALLDAGADDAWLVPILMKKGRPAFTLRVLVPAVRAEAVQRVVFAHTSAIGLRRQPVDKVALARQVVAVDVDGQPVRVKLAYAPDGRVVNAQPEWDDVAALAQRLDQPAKVILARALTAYWERMAEEAHDHQ
jgi:pyridinium-3,5-bisthiocarboxylic acid mononucleotide nickel chelatase